MHTIIFAKKRR